MKRNVLKAVRRYNEIRPKAKGEIATPIVVDAIVAGDKAIKSLLGYVKALEDHIFEVDEVWDKLLKDIEQARESGPKPVGKKLSYIK